MRPTRLILTSSKFKQALFSFMVSLPVAPVSALVQYGNGWLYAVAVSNSHRRRSIGSALVHRAKDSLRSLVCGKINLQVRSTNVPVAEFCRKLGYLTEGRVSMGKRITDPL